jgi:hypothetical protein
MNHMLSGLKHKKWLQQSLPACYDTEQPAQR